MQSRDPEDAIVVVATRDAIEACNVGPALRMLQGLLADRRTVLKYERRLVLRVDGYGREVGPLCFIPEFRAYMAKLDNHFAYWFYFMPKWDRQLLLVEAALCRWCQGADGKPGLEEKDLFRLIERHYMAMVSLVQRFALGDAVRDRVGEDVRKYFLRPEVLEMVAKAGTATWELEESPNPPAQRGSGKTAFRSLAPGTRVMVAIGRQDVEACNIEPVLGVLQQLLADRETVQHCRDSVLPFVDGYDDDPRALFEIPEVRRFVAALDERFPYWFYFVPKERDNLLLILLCLIPCQRKQDGRVACDFDAAGRFAERHFGAMNWLFERYGLDEALNDSMSDEINAYFGARLGK